MSLTPNLHHGDDFDFFFKSDDLTAEMGRWGSVSCAVLVSKLSFSIWENFTDLYQALKLFLVIIKFTRLTGA